MKRLDVLFMVLKVPVDYVMLLFAAATAYVLRLSNFFVALREIQFDVTFAEFMYQALFVAAGWILVYAVYGLYQADRSRKLGQDIQSIIFASTSALALVALFIFFRSEQFDSRFLVAVSFIFAIVYTVIGRIMIRTLRIALYKGGSGLRRVILVGDKTITKEFKKTLSTHLGFGYDVVGSFETFTQKDQEKIVKLHIDEVIVMNTQDSISELKAAERFCDQYHKTLKYSADLLPQGRVNIFPLAGVPIAEMKRTSLDGWGRVGKRLFDIGFSLFVIIITSPITLISALVILVETGFPIIYKNERIGIRGKSFLVLKFRSMYQKDSTGVQFGDSGKDALKREKELIKKQSTRKGPIYKIGNDPRVTPFGKLIRRWSVDELPQFWNVLKGDMSVVGPRPHQPREVEQYEKDNKVLFTLKPGITGLAQISGRSDLSFEDEVKLDRFYIERWNILLDLIIVIKTPFVLLKKRKAL